jgi:hypothetical protein
MSGVADKQVATHYQIKNTQHAVRPVIRGASMHELYSLRLGIRKRRRAEVD